jgi:hypothetical protein
MILVNTDSSISIVYSVSDTMRKAGEVQEWLAKRRETSGKFTFKEVSKRRSEAILAALDVSWL